MFTGLVQAIGRVLTVADGVVSIAADWENALEIGESVAISGICLTVTGIQARQFRVEVSPTTLARTTADQWTADRPVNLERALAFGDRLGGHLVTGHVDGTARLLERRATGNSERFRFELPTNLAAQFVSQG
ncbi:MAG: riboflavin synthase, partial [Cyanobacteria bacterium REEB65]|nr:riboflavin synthase [Cyanobacteria bacterium REEB65]